MIKKKIAHFLATAVVLFGIIACGSTGGAPTPSEESNVSPHPPGYVELATGQAASKVIGQKDFGSVEETDPTMAIRSARGTPLIADDALYIPDLNRVMVYSPLPTNDRPAAGFVIGKPDLLDLDEVGPNPSASTLHAAMSVFTDGTDLYVVDSGHHRILRYAGFPKTNNPQADAVIGQPNFDSGDGRCAADSLFSPQDAVIAGGKLVVADTGNNRVLIWDQVPSASGEGATLVLGQTGFDSCGGDTSRTSMLVPSSVWSDGERLLVADQGNNRVLVWNEFPTVGNTEPDLVLGQENFDASATGSGAASMNFPGHVVSNGTQIFVSDINNNRVLVWNEFPTENGEAAAAVIGQKGFGQGSKNGGEGRPNSLGFDHVGGLMLHEGELYVGDANNGRYLVFEKQE